MGYMSDVVIAFAFNSKEQIDEVMAIYRMHKLVQEYDLAKEWQVHDWNGVWGLTYSSADVKWYETYDDVQGFQHMENVVVDFAENRKGFEYAYRTLRIGEDDADIEENHHGHQEDNSALADELWDRMSLRRDIETTF
jgi:hypothetical protein